MNLTLLTIEFKTGWQGIVPPIFLTLSEVVSHKVIVVIASKVDNGSQTEVISDPQSIVRCSWISTLDSWLWGTHVIIISKKYIHVLYIHVVLL